MKLNSSTVLLNNENLQKLVEIAENIAKKNEVYNVRTVDISLDPTSGEVKFGTAEEDEIKPLIEELANIEEREEKLEEGKEKLIQDWKSIETKEKGILEKLQDKVK